MKEGRASLLLLDLSLMDGWDEEMRGCDDEYRRIMGASLLLCILLVRREKTQKFPLLLCRSYLDRLQPDGVVNNPLAVFCIMCLSFLIG